MIPRLFIDSDIVLDVLAKREPYYSDSAMILSLAENKNVHAFTSPLVFANVFYILRKLRSKDYALRSLRKLRILLDVLPIERKHIDEALNSNFLDFEDAIQHFAAVSRKVEYLITRNKIDYKHGRIPVCNPQEFLNLVSSSDS